MNWIELNELHSWTEVTFLLWKNGGAQYEILIALSAEVAPRITGVKHVTGTLGSTVL